MTTLYQKHYYLLTSGVDKYNAANLAQILDTLEKDMADNVVKFSFKKKDGTTRTAYGTRNSEIVNRYWTETDKNNTSTENVGIMKYFDIEKQAWRSFKMENMLGIDNDYTV